MHTSYPQSVHCSKHHVLTDVEQPLLMQAASHCSTKAIKFEESEKIKNKKYKIKKKTRGRAMGERVGGRRILNEA